MAADRRRLSRVLIVEDQRDLRKGIARLAATWGAEVLEAASVAEAIALLHPPPDLLILDVHLPDGSAFDVLDAAASVLPAPIKVALSGVASANESFRLSEHGVRAFLQKPISLDDLDAAVTKALEEPPGLLRQVQDSVGLASIREVQAEIRQTMLSQAMALAEGKKNRAARLLGVTRQAVQQMIRQPKPDDRDGGDEPPASA